MGPPPVKWALVLVESDPIRSTYEVATVLLSVDLPVFVVELGAITSTYVGAAVLLGVDMSAFVLVPAEPGSIKWCLIPAESEAIKSTYVVATVCFALTGQSCSRH